MTSTDALDKTFKPFGKNEKRVYAQQKAAAEETKVCTDQGKVLECSKKYRERIRQERIRLGLEKP